MMSHQGAAQVTLTEPNLTEPALTHATLTEGADPAAKRILIVDDEPNIRSFIGRALAGAGYLTGFAGSGTEALRRALDSHYDLVILDLVMPDMDGCSVLDQLLRARPDQTVMVLSCVADVATKVDCLERGARDYLTKPFSLAELLARIRVRLREDAHLHGDALRPGEAAGEVVRAGQPDPGRGPAGRRHRAGAGAPDAAGVLAAARAGGALRPVRTQGQVAGQRVGIRLRPGLQRGRRVRATPAVKARLQPDQDGTR